MDQFSAHAVATANEPKAPASRNRLEGHLCVVGGEFLTCNTEPTKGIQHHLR